MDLARHVLEIASDPAVPRARDRDHRAGPQRMPGPRGHDQGPRQHRLRHRSLRIPAADVPVHGVARRSPARGGRPRRSRQRCPAEPWRQASRSTRYGEPRPVSGRSGESRSHPGERRRAWTDCGDRRRQSRASARGSRSRRRTPTWSRTPLPPTVRRRSSASRTPGSCWPAWTPPCTSRGSIASPHVRRRSRLSGPPGTPSAQCGRSRLRGALSSRRVARAARESGRLPDAARVEGSSAAARRPSASRLSVGGQPGVGSDAAICSARSL